MGVNKKIADEIVREAWRKLPAPDRALLETIRAHQWKVCDRPLGSYAQELLLSADRGFLADSEIARANAALGIWIPQLRVVLIHYAHPAFGGLDAESFSWALTRVAWHEWGHALSIDRASQEDVDAGDRHLKRLPPPLAKLVRDSGYRRREYTHEIVAEVYSILMMKLPAGYLLPEGKTMADVRQIDLELFASEGLDVEPKSGGDSPGDSSGDDG